jgi:hypothetical protein
VREVFAVTPPKYVCPNGHRVEAYLRVECPRGYCEAAVIYEPSARVIELERELERARRVIEELSAAKR